MGDFFDGTLEEEMYCPGVPISWVPNTSERGLARQPDKVWPGSFALGAVSTDPTPPSIAEDTPGLFDIATADLSTDERAALLKATAELLNEGRPEYASDEDLGSREAAVKFFLESVGPRLGRRTLGAGYPEASSPYADKLAAVKRLCVELRGQSSCGLAFQNLHTF